jgi:DNA adenine methylase
VTDPVDRAVNFFICCRQSRAGMRGDFTPITRTRLRRGMNGNASEWLGAVEGLEDVHNRLKRVVVESTDGVELISREDTEHTLFYLDPPYLPGAVATAGLYGTWTMTVEDHERMLSYLLHIRGRAILSGYRSPLYDEHLKGWRRVDIGIANHLAGGRSKRRMVESLWMNY